MQNSERISTEQPDEENEISRCFSEHAPSLFSAEHFPEGAGASSLEADDVQPLRHVGQAGLSFVGHAPDGRHRRARLRASSLTRESIIKHSIEMGWTTCRQSKLQSHFRGAQLLPTSARLDRTSNNRGIAKIAPEKCLASEIQDRVRQH